MFTDTGTKDIKDVEVGDLVWAYNNQTGEKELKKVINTFTKDRDHVYKIHFGEDVIEATNDHPFFIGGQWVDVEYLKVGDKLALYSGENIAIDKIEFVKGNFKVFNFEVEDYHTYYVSRGNVLVHNSNCDWTPKQKKKMPAWVKEGKDFETNYFAKLKKEGKRVYTQISFRATNPKTNKEVTAVVDGIIVDDQGVMTFIETKLRNTTDLTTNQKIVYKALANGEAIPTGDKAKEIFKSNVGKVLTDKIEVKIKNKYPPN